MGELNTTTTFLAEELLDSRDDSENQRRTAAEVWNGHYNYYQPHPTR